MRHTRRQSAFVDAVTPEMALDMSGSSEISSVSQLVSELDRQSNTPDDATIANDMWGGLRSPQQNTRAHSKTNGVCQCHHT